MAIVLAVLAGLLVVVGLILAARWLDALVWRRSLVAFRLIMPHGLAVQDVASWLTLVNGATHAHAISLLAPPPVAIEIVATNGEIGHYVLVPRTMRDVLMSGLRATLPGARLEDAPDYLTTRSRLRWGAEAGITSHRRPLRADLAETASVALLASLQPLFRSECVVVQWLVTGGGIPRVVPSASSRSRQSSGWPGNRRASVDVEATRAERVKQQRPLLRAAVRVGVSSPDRRRVYSVFGRVWATLRTLNASGVGVVRRSWLPPSLVSDRMRRLALPVTAWPLTLNTVELAGLLGLATGGSRLPGVSHRSSRQLPPPMGMSKRGAVLAVSNYPGMTDRHIALRRSDRLRHTWVLGPTGAGKSTLLGNLIVQDMEAGDGLVLVDARGDLVPDILSRVPEDRQEDVVVIDPSEVTRPVGFNVLNLGSSDELGRERAVDNVLHIFGDLYRSSWGPRAADIVRSGLLTLANIRARDGSVFTLCELPELLTNHQFRRYVTSQPGVSDTLASFWHWYEGLSDAQRAEVTGPVLNKLRAFVLKAPIRLLLGQSKGFDLTDVFRRRRIVLVPLSKGTLGVETAQLIGSLLVASLWQVTLDRVRTPQARRRPSWFYADEFQETVRLPFDLADMLAQARGFGLGLVLAHQHLGQLPDAVKTAVLATARTQILFQLDYDDAGAMEQRFEPLTTQDLMGLGQHEIALRPCIDGRTADVTTGTTLPLPEPTLDGHALALASRERFGVPRSEVEASLTARLQTRREDSAYGVIRGGQI